MTRTLNYFAGVSVAALALAAYATTSTSQSQVLPENLGEYEHINSIVVPDAKSPVMGFHHFYMNGTGLDTFQTMQDDMEFPAGTVIVGKVYQPLKTEDGAYREGKLLAYTLMRKSANGPTTEDTGGWQFAKFDSQGKPVKIDPVADCFHCHKPHAATDYVISDPLE